MFLFLKFDGASPSKPLQHFKTYFYSFIIKYVFALVQVNQLKSAIQIHNESIQFLKCQNAELRDELDEGKGKVRATKFHFQFSLFTKPKHDHKQLQQNHEYYSEMKKRNIDLETEVRKAI